VSELSLPTGGDKAGQFARDILLYDQGGCLSAQAVLVEEQNVAAAAQRLAESLERECVALDIPPVTDPAVARTVRQARDMALFLGDDVTLIGDAALRWTIIARSSPAPLEFPVGSCVRAGRPPFSVPFRSASSWEQCAVIFRALASQGG
jgi:hypothetical protein